MTTDEQNTPSNAELLAHIQSLQSAMRDQHTAMQREIDTLKAQSRDKGVKEPRPNQRYRDPSLRAIVGGSVHSRAKRLTVGLSLAALLLFAPSQSIVTHASGVGETKYGTFALNSNSGTYDSAFGSNALVSNTSGNDNTAVGAFALSANASGHFNNALGAFALSSSTADANNAFGYYSLYQNSTGTNNVAFGHYSLYKNSTGSNNTAVGDSSGYNLTSGNGNTTGTNDTFIGYNAGPGSTPLDNATAIGANALVEQSNSIVLGGVGPNTQRIGVGTSTPHSALQIAVGFLQYRAITGAPPADKCVTAADYGRTVVRTDGIINLYVCVATGWIGK